jgi:hypothetical protein
VPHKARRERAERVAVPTKRLGLPRAALTAPDELPSPPPAALVVRVQQFESAAVETNYRQHRPGKGSDRRCRRLRCRAPINQFEHNVISFEQSARPVSGNSSRYWR